MKKVIVIGSGISGLFSALTLAEANHEVLIFSPSFPERSQSTMAAGGINAVIHTDNGDSIESHIEDTFKGGCYIEDRKVIEGLCNTAPEIIKKLESYGMIFSRNKDGSIATRSFGGQSYPRTCYSGTCTGKQIVSCLSRQIMQYVNKGIITYHFGYHFHSALIRNNTCYGAILYNEKEFKTEIFYADALIVATGGQHSLFGHTTGGSYSDGYTVGKLFEQGVYLRNLEFIQYHPTTISSPIKNFLISEAARGEGGRLYYLNDNDERVYFMEDKYGPKGNLMPRDIVSRCISECPSQVYLDVTFLGKKLIIERLYEVYELCNLYFALDISKSPIPVSPGIHFFMGGVNVDINHQTNIKNLYAVGECASMYHGANRLGGNSLLAACYSGYKAGTHISSIDEEKETISFEEEFNKISNDLDKLRNSRSTFSASSLLNDVYLILDRSLGITRNEEDLLKGIADINFYIEKAKEINFDKDAELYNAYRIHNMLLLAKAILTSALERKESRGAHQRKDYPETKNEYACPSIAKYEDHKITVLFKGKE